MEAPLVNNTPISDFLSGYFGTLCAVPANNFSVWVGVGCAQSHDLGEVGRASFILVHKNRLDYTVRSLLRHW